MKAIVLRSPESAAKLIRVSGKAIRVAGSFEFFFVMFLFSGAYKAHPRIAWFPVDATLVAVAMSLFAGAYILVREYRVRLSWPVNVVVLAYTAFVAWCLLTLVWSPNPQYGIAKALNLATLVSWSFLGGLLIIGRDRSRVRRFVLLVMALAAWLGLEAMVALVLGEASNVYGWSQHYLGIGRILGYGTVLASIELTFGHPSARQKGVLTLALILFALGLLAVGGRGPLVTVIVGMMYIGSRATDFSGLRIRIIRAWAVLLGFFCAAVLVLFPLLQDLMTLKTLERLMSAYSHGGGSSVFARLRFFEQAWNGWADNPVVGVGLGGFGKFIDRGDVRAYPHNLFLELLVETGAIGLLFFVALSFPIILQGVRDCDRRDFLRVAVVALVLVSLLNTQVTGDLSDNRAFFAFLGVLGGMLTNRNVACLSLSNSLKIR